MAGSSTAFIVVYTLAVLFLLVSVGYGYCAWQNYRRTMNDALQRRRERDVERGDRLTTDNYWIRDPPPPAAPLRVPGAPFSPLSAASTARHYHPVAIHVYSPSFKACAAVSTATPLHGAGGG